MALAPRPIKTGGTQSYVAEVGLGNTTILAVEVDDDFDTLYDEFNGNIDNANIAASANIATSKIAQDAGLQTGHYADDSVTTAKLADNAVTDAKLSSSASIDADRAVTTDHIRDGAVTVAKIDPGATVRYSQTVSDTASNAFTAEETILTHTARTPAGPASITVLLVNVAGILFFGAANSTATVVMRLKRNGTTIASASCDALWPSAATFAGVTMPFSLNLTIDQALLITSQTYTVTIELVSTGTVTATAKAAYSTLIEHS